MELFNCTVRLAGNVNHEVPRLNVTQREMQLLRDIHGADGVVNTKPAKQTTVERTDEEDLLLLAKQYGKARVEACFHVKLDNFDAWMQEQREAMDAAEQEELEKRTRPAEKGGKQQQATA